jgi:hypothetical protein
VSVNYVGVGRFAVAIGEDVSWCLKARDIRGVKQMYEDIKRFTYRQADDNVYGRLGSGMDIDKFGLTVEQTEILYNVECYKTLNDIQATKLLINTDGIKRLKQNWLDDWKEYISKGFASFLQIKNAELHWCSEQELLQKVVSVLFISVHLFLRVIKLL